MDLVIILLPEESLKWDDSQLEDYFRNDQGLELIDLLLPFIAESIESDEDAADLRAFLEEIFAHDPVLRAYYFEMFFGMQPETGGDNLEEPLADQEMVPSENEPAGDISAAPSDKKRVAKKSAESAAPALANTGFDGFMVAGGLLVALAGAVIVALGRRK